MKDTKYIIKRVIIGILIGLILSFIRTLLIVNVSALEIENDTKPIIYTPKGQSFTGDINKNPISYNYQISESTPMEIRFITAQSSTKLYPSLQENYPYYAVDITNNTNFQQEDKYYTLGLESNNYLEQLTFTTYSTSNEYIKKDMKYSILIKITKPNEIKYYDNNNNNKTNIENVDLNYFTLLAQNGANQTDITQNIEVTKFQYVKGLNLKAGGDNPKFSNDSFILIEYRTKENLEENTYRLTNQTISFSINKYGYIDGEEEYFFKNDKYFLENDTNQIQEIKYNFVFLEGGMVDWCGLGDGESGGCGRYFGGDLDKVTTEDQKVLEEIEDCEPLDVACHVKNGVKMLESIFIRIGNGIRDFFQGLVNLFIPDFKNINTTFQEMKNVLITKTGFLYQSEQFFETLLNRFIGLFTNTSDAIIYIPQIKVPNFNYTIIESQQWNISSYFRDNEILEHFYNNYKILISGVFIFLLIEHSRRRLGTILNIGDMYENGTIREGIK